MRTDTDKAPKHHDDHEADAMSTKTRGLALGALCAGVMVAGSALVGPVPFSRVVSAAVNLGQDTGLGRCELAGPKLPNVPDVYIAPTQGSDLLAAARLASHLDHTTPLRVQVTPPMGNCRDCMDPRRKQLAAGPFEARAAGFLPELRRHGRTLTVVLTESDLFSRLEPERPFVFAHRSVRQPVAIVSTARLGDDDELAQLRLHKLVTRQVAKKALSCPVSDDPRSVLYSQAPEDLDDLDTMMLPEPF
jgi:predicted Zn-dependent protease